MEENTYRLTLVGYPDDIWTEDSGAAKIAEISDECDVFVRIHSYRDDKVHEQFDKLIRPHKMYRVTIEEVE